MILTAWLDEMPDDWACVPAWSLFSERVDKAEPDAVHLTPSQTYGVLPQTEYMEITGSRVVLNLTGADKMKAVYEGDFISHLRSFQGGLEQSSLRGKVSQAYTVLRPSPLVQSGYFRYLMKSRIFIEQLNNLTDQLRDGQTINYARFARMGLPLPPLESQRIIAQYLDHETGEIDAMLAKLSSLSEALAERKVLVIQNLTQRSDSGVRWTAVPTAHLFSSIGSGTTPKGVHNYAESGSGIPWVTTSELRESVIVETTQDVTEEAVGALSALRVHPRGSVVIAMYGATIGRLAMLGVDAAMNQACCAFSSPRNVDSRFFYYALWGQREELILEANGGGQPNISQGFLRRWRVPCPPLVEQRRIADRLDEVTGRVDAMLTKIDELKALLVERRSALITDVVTGRKKIPS